MDELLARRTVSGTICAKSPVLVVVVVLVLVVLVVLVGQLTVQLSSLLGLLVVSRRPSFSKRVYVIWERSTATCFSWYVQLAAQLAREQGNC